MRDIRGKIYHDLTMWEASFYVEFYIL